MKYLKPYLKLAAVAALLLGLLLALIYLRLRLFPVANDLRPLLGAGLILAGLFCGWQGARLFFPHWLKAGLMALACLMLLLSALWLSLLPMLSGPGLLLPALLLLSPAALLGALAGCGWRLAVDLRRQAADKGENP